MRFNTPEEVLAWAEKVAREDIERHIKYGIDLNPFCTQGSRDDWRRGYENLGPRSYVTYGVDFDTMYQRGAAVARLLDKVTVEVVLDDKFTRHYLIAAMWSTNDESTPEGGEPFDVNYSLDDLAPATAKKAYEDCALFQKRWPNLLKLAYEFYDKNGNSYHPDAGSPEACAGHDFWLTRNGHGVGFWDRGMGLLGERLTTASKEFPECDLYLGDDGKIYMA